MQIDEAKAKALAAEQLVIATIVKPAAWRPFGFSEQLENLLHRLITARVTIVASPGVPHVLEQYLSAALGLCTRSDVPASQEALAKMLFNEEE